MDTFIFHRYLKTRPGNLRNFGLNHQFLKRKVFRVELERLIGQLVSDIYSRSTKVERAYCGQGTNIPIIVLLVHRSMGQGLDGFSF